MPVMRWGAFTAAHPRPYVIFADRGQGQFPQAAYELLRRHILKMAPEGSFSLYPEEGFIRVAFELETDAMKFAAGLRAKRTAREGGWVGQWSFAYDEKAAKTIESLLEPLKRAGTTRAGVTRKIKKRMLPF